MYIDLNTRICGSTRIYAGVVATLVLCCCVGPVQSTILGPVQSITLVHGACYKYHSGPDNSIILVPNQWKEKCRRLQFSGDCELGVRQQISSEGEPVEAMAVLGYLPALLHSS